MDAYDRKILAALQADGRLTNAELSERVNLSPSQCSRRRSRLEQDGVIVRYGAHLDREKAGYGLATFISVTLATHNRDNAQRFAQLVGGCPEVLEAHALTGEMDYLLKVVVRDLAALSGFVNETLLPHDSVLNVKTSIVLETLKEEAPLPL
ncbi:Lrp/AsnC family transcriptional regulator [Amorphus orientalis]|uniref:DNA-binding Lrp family transcriptional regulator n=1 Tax=Amorphus orientalis TaxID=649198 RepID=A0AAE3VTB2_9HYPH|nr:DNA-binding Lrp family transcriptional regulator [Amorphus orientalis]